MTALAQAQSPPAGAAEALPQPLRDTCAKPAPAVPSDDPRRDLVGLDLGELCAITRDMGLPDFRAGQIYRWIYARGARDFDSMTDLAKPLRQQLQEAFRISRPEVTTESRSTDGTCKWLLRYADGSEAETVYIPNVGRNDGKAEGDNADDPDHDGHAGRGALCLSSQVGCSLTCGFCHTGTQVLARNLTVGDIVGQIMLARDLLHDWGAGAGANADTGSVRAITNIVMMGMGEPLFNTDNVIRAVRLMTDPAGLAFGRRRVTVSTSGVVPNITRLGTETGVMLAVSLHAVSDELRSRLVPINRKYPLSGLLAAVSAYPGLNNARRVTWEYVMLRDVNDNDAAARALARRIAGIPSKINLIPFNPWPGADFTCSTPTRIAAFADVLRRAGFPTTVRKTRGQDILAACGQLKSASRPVSRSRLAQLASLRREKESAIGLAG